MRNYKDYEIWKRGMDLVIAIYEMADFLPSEEKFGLKSQISRACISILQTSQKVQQRIVKRILKDF